MAIHLEIEEWAEVFNRVQRAEAQRDQLHEALLWVVNRAKQNERGDDVTDDFYEWFDFARAALNATEEG